jgi:hypothetical protein
MKCEHNPKIQCEYLDTAGMDKPVECKDCSHYKEPDETGTLATGATPFLAWLINKWKYRKIKKIKVSDPKMYECTCKFCGKKFSSSVPGFNCCPSCYV